MINWIKHIETYDVRLANINNERILLKEITLLSDGSIKYKGICSDGISRTVVTSTANFEREFKVNLSDTPFAILILNL